MSITVAIIGATGYSGQELTDILIAHPKVAKIYLASRGEVGKPINIHFVKKTGKINENYLSPSDELLLKTDVVFFATPNVTALKSAKAFIDAGVKVIDLSADFRLQDVDLYKKWYGEEHNQPELLSEAVYGLSEIYKEDIGNARLIANPGCYASAAQFGLFPALSQNLIQTDKIVVDGKSGTSGAGKKLDESFLFCEVNESLRAYSISGHRHHPEIVSNLNKVSKTPINLTFVPHLIPMQRGILATIYCYKNLGVSAQQIRSSYEDFYNKAAFVRVLPKGKTPATGDVSRTNFCDIGLEVSDESDVIIITSAIDNMVKGAAGQAVQNMNIMLKIPETFGLIN